MKTLLIAGTTVVLLAAENLAPEPLRRDRTPRRRAKNALHSGKSGPLRPFYMGKLNKLKQNRSKSYQENYPTHGYAVSVRKRESYCGVSSRH